MRKTRRGGITKSELEAAAQRLVESEAAGGAGPAAAGLNLPGNLEQYYNMISTGNLQWGNFENLIESGLGKYNIGTLRLNRSRGIRRPLRSASSRSASTQRLPSERKLTRKQERAVIAAQAEADRLEREALYAGWKGTRSEFNRMFPPRTKSEVARRRKQAIEEALNRL